VAVVKARLIIDARQRDLYDSPNYHYAKAAAEEKKNHS